MRSSAVGEDLSAILHQLDVSQVKVFQAPGGPFVGSLWEGAPEATSPMGAIQNWAGGTRRATGRFMLPQQHSTTISRQTMDAHSRWLLNKWVICSCQYWPGDIKWLCMCLNTSCIMSDSLVILSCRRKKKAVSYRQTVTDHRQCHVVRS